MMDDFGSIFLRLCYVLGAVVLYEMAKTQTPFSSSWYVITIGMSVGFSLALSVQHERYD